MTSAPRPPATAGIPARRSQAGLPCPAPASALLAFLATFAAGCAAAADAPPAPATLEDLALASRALQGSGAIPAARTERREATQAVSSPRAACLQAVRQSEAAHGIPQGLLVAVALAESGLHAFAMNIAGRTHLPSSPEDARRIYRAARPGQPVMAGCMQVNAGVHARGADWPLDPWRATEWGAGLLRAHYEKSGSWAGAVRRWNGGGASGERLACRVQAKLQVTNPGSNALSGARCGGNPRERRNGAALLEIAEAGE